MKEALIILALTLGSAVYSATCSAAPKLYFFIPSDQKAASVEKELKQTCANVDVLVFGRAKDFISNVGTNPPDGIVTLGPLAESLSDYTLIMQGIREDKAENPMLFASIKKEFDVKTLDQYKVGVIDFMGRKQMKAYVSELTGKKLKLKRSVNPKDLLLMLTFGSADAILIFERDLNKMLDKSEQEIFVHDAGYKVTNAVFAAKNKDDAMSTCIQGLSSELNSYLGVESWKK